MSTSPAANAENKASRLQRRLDNLGVAMIKGREGCCAATGGFVGAPMRISKDFDDSCALLRFVKRAGGLFHCGTSLNLSGLCRHSH